MLTSQYAPVKQAGNGSIVAFNFSFKILAASDLVVTKFDANGVQSATLILGTDYTVTFDPVAETGTVTYTVAPVTGGYSNIARKSDNTQQTSLPREGVAPAKTVETMIDKMALLLQEIQAQVNTLVLTPTTTLTLIQVGTFAALDLLGNTTSTPFVANATDRRLIMVFLGNGNRGLGQNGWVSIKGY